MGCHDDHDATLALFPADDPSLPMVKPLMAVEWRQNGCCQQYAPIATRTLESPSGIAINVSMGKHRKPQRMYPQAIKDRRCVNLH